MKVLVTGGTGVIGTAAVRSLLAAGCSVRLFSRYATQDAARFGSEGRISKARCSSWPAPRSPPPTTCWTGWRGSRARTPSASPSPRPSPRWAHRWPPSWGLRVPVDENKVAMLKEENVLRPGEVNALTDVFGIFPTRLDEGFERLINSQPEQLPDETGTGSLVRRLFFALLSGVERSPADLFEGFRRSFFEIVPEGTMGPADEPAAEQRIEWGSTLTLSLPMRGHVQVRVVEMTDTSMTYATVAGHPLAGEVVFRFTGVPGEDLRFEVETCDRPANPPDALAMYPLGLLMKRWNWIKVVERTAEWSGARPPIEVKTSEQTLSDEEAREAGEEIRQRVNAFTRDAEKTLEVEAKVRLETART